MPQVNVSSGFQLYYEQHGEGEPLVFVNGVYGSTLSWGPMVELLKNDFSLYVYDNRDQGQSQTAEEYYSFDAYIEDLKDLLDAWGLKKINLLGISLGATIAMKFAIKYPEYLSRLVLASPVSEWSDQSMLFFDYCKYIMDEKGLEEYYKSTMTYAVGEKFFDKIQGSLDALAKSFASGFKDHEHCSRMYEIAKTAFPFTHDLKKITASTLILAGDEDRYTPLSRARIVHQNINESELKIISDCGHSIHAEQPVMMANEVKAFCGK